MLVARSARRMRSAQDMELSVVNLPFMTHLAPLIKNRSL